MSMTNCCICSETYDSDFQLESYKGECICDKCFEEKEEEEWDGVPMAEGPQHD